MTVVSKRHRILTSQVWYPDGEGGKKAAQPGAVVDDLPRQSLGWLEEQGYVERTTDPVQDAPDPWEGVDPDAISEDSDVEGEAV